MGKSVGDAGVVALIIGAVQGKFTKPNSRLLHISGESRPLAFLAQAGSECQVLSQTFLPYFP
jgi:hypothetical protein